MIASLSFTIRSNVHELMLTKSNEKRPPVFFCISGGDMFCLYRKLILISNVNDYLELKCKKMIVIRDRNNIYKRIR